MKHTAIIRTEDLANLNLPPGCTLRLKDGREVHPAEISSLTASGQTVEIYQDGQNIGRLRPPIAGEQLSPENVNLLGDMIETCRRENFKSAVNWIDYAKHRFWCPVCAKDQSKPVAFSAWVHQGRAIGMYAVCKRCGKQRNSYARLGDQAGSHRLVDLTERHLVARYPHLAANLSPNYFGETDPPTL